MDFCQANSNAKFLPRQWCGGNDVTLKELRRFGLRNELAVDGFQWGHPLAAPCPNGISMVVGLCG